MCEVLVIGAGPTGAMAAIHAARAGYQVTVLEAGKLGRDKVCGDGLTPRAVAQLDALGLSAPITGRHRISGLKLHGFGADVTAPWPESAYGQVGSAMRRTQFDHYLVRAAIAAGAEVREETTAVAPELTGGRITGVRVRRGGGVRGRGAGGRGGGAGAAGRGAEAAGSSSATAAASTASTTAAAGAATSEEVLRPRWVLVADGVRSTFGKQLGRRWHRENVYGVAARAYATTPRHKEEWMHSHLDLRSPAGDLLGGYGWIFPLGDSTVNIGCGALSTSARPAQVNTKKLLVEYASNQSVEWQLGELSDVNSAMLPMGGAVSNVAGPNWMLLGDAAAGVNPLNGEGIDYGMEMAELAVGLLGEHDGGSGGGSSVRGGGLTHGGGPGEGFTRAWPELLREHYGEAFLLARSVARLLTYPRFMAVAGPVAMRGPIGTALMPAAARLMANLVTDADRDLIARAWRLAAGANALRERGTAGQTLWG